MVTSVQLRTGNKADTTSSPCSPSTADKPFRREGLSSTLSFCSSYWMKTRCHRQSAASRQHYPPAACFRWTGSHSPAEAASLEYCRPRHWASVRLHRPWPEHLASTHRLPKCLVPEAWRQSDPRGCPLQPRLAWARHYSDRPAACQSAAPHRSPARLRDPLSLPRRYRCLRLTASVQQRPLPGSPESRSPASDLSAWVRPLLRRSIHPDGG